MPASPDFNLHRGFMFNSVKTYVEETFKYGLFNVSRERALGKRMAVLLSGREFLLLGAAIMTVSGYFGLIGIPGFLEGVFIYM